MEQLKNPIVLFVRNIFPLNYKTFKAVGTKTEIVTVSQGCF
jgi:hypothetical protein